MGPFLITFKLAGSENGNSACKYDYRGEKAEGNWLAKTFCNRMWHFAFRSLVQPKSEGWKGINIIR